MRFQSRSRGFTVVEILVVLGVLAALAAVVIPSVSGFLARGKEQSWTADSKSIQAAVDAYFADPGNTRFEGKRQYPIYARSASTNLAGAACADDLAANVGENPDRGQKGGDPTWVDDDANGIRGTGEKWDKATQIKGTTTYCYSTGNFIIDMDQLVTGGFLKNLPKSASKDTHTDGTGSYTWYVDVEGKVHSLYYYFPDKTTKKDFVAGVYP